MSLWEGGGGDPYYAKYGGGVRVKSCHKKNKDELFSQNVHEIRIFEFKENLNLVPNELTIN